MSAPRGLAAMPVERRREIASMGGKIAHELGLAHEWTSEEAAEAGRKGGLAVSADRARMAALGHLGGSKKAANRRATSESGIYPTPEAL